MPKKPTPEGEDPLYSKYNSGIRMLLAQNIFYKFYATHVRRGATDRSTLIREALGDNIKKLEDTLSPEERAVLDRMIEEEVALVLRKQKEKARNRKTLVLSDEEKKAVKVAAKQAGPRPKKTSRHVRSSA